MLINGSDAINHALAISLFSIQCCHDARAFGKKLDVRCRALLDITLKIVSCHMPHANFVCAKRCGFVHSQFAPTCGLVENRLTPGMVQKVIYVLWQNE